mmetsp:Transcript_1742/g.4087  ORF Transcript_1742/g.4087 Transcript_1742/m.4087 type:complete len:363 (+) Transcript_1742:2505-3593(+)
MLGVSKVFLTVAVTSCGLNTYDGLHIVVVLLATAAKVKFTRVEEQCWTRESIRCGTRPCKRVLASNVALNNIESNTTDTRSCATEAALDEFFTNAYSLKNLSTLVRLDRGNTNLTQNLADALGKSNNVALHNVIHATGLGDLAVAPEMAECLVCHVRVDGIGTKANQAAKMVYLTAVATLDHKCNVGTLLSAQKVLVNCSQSDETWDRNYIRASSAVCDEEAGGMLETNGLRSLLTDAHKSSIERTGSLAALVSGVDDNRLPVVTAKTKHAFGLTRTKDRVLDQEAAGLGGRYLKNVSHRAHRALHGHNTFLTDRVHGRIGHLSKELLKVVKDRARFVTETGERCIHTHRAESFLLGLDHRW